MSKSERGKEFIDDWWKLRMFLKPKIYNPASPISLKTWKGIKRKVKDDLEINGYESAKEMAIRYIKSIKTALSD